MPFGHFAEFLRCPVYTNPYFWDISLKFSDRTILCLGVNSGHFMGLLAFIPPLFSDRVTVRIDIGPCTGHWFRSICAVNVGFARASRLRYLFSRSSVLRGRPER